MANQAAKDAHNSKVDQGAGTSQKGKSADARWTAPGIIGKPGKTPTRGFITISTCATFEDHAAGNYWTDQFGNPEHRIDKIGVLVKRVARPAD